MDMNGKNLGEIVKGHATGPASQASANKISNAGDQVGNARPGRHHNLHATEDINKMMAIKSRSIALNKSLAGLTASEAECFQRIESMERYLDTLTKKLEGLRHAARRLAEEAAIDGIAPDAKAKAGIPRQPYQDAK